MKNIIQVDNYAILRDWVVHKNKDEDYIYLTGNVTRSYKFSDGSNIYTSEILGMARFTDYIMFQTHNSFYRCYKNDHVLNFDDLLYLFEIFPQFTKESFEELFQEIQHLSTLKAQNEEKKKLNLFPKECKRGMMFIFDKYTDFYFDSLIVKYEDEELKVEEYEQIYIEGKEEIFISIPIYNAKRNAICLFVRNEDGIYLALWNKILGDVYVCNYSKDPMFFKTEDQEGLIEQYEVIKVFDNGL